MSLIVSAFFPLKSSRCVKNSSNNSGKSERKRKFQEIALLLSVSVAIDANITSAQLSKIRQEKKNSSGYSQMKLFTPPISKWAKISSDISRRGTDRQCSPVLIKTK